MVFQFIFLEMYFVNFSVNIVRYAHCNYELFQEERKILLEKCMTVLQRYLSGMQKQDTIEWENRSIRITLPIYNV